MELAAWGVDRAALALQLGERTAVLAAVLLLAPGILGGSQFEYPPDVIALPFWCGCPWPAWRDDGPPAVCLPSWRASARNSPGASRPRQPVAVPTTVRFTPGRYRVQVSVRGSTTERAALDVLTFDMVGGRTVSTAAVVPGRAAATMPVAHTALAAASVSSTDSAPRGGRGATRHPGGKRVTA